MPSKPTPLTGFLQIWLAADCLPARGLSSDGMQRTGSIAIYLADYYHARMETASSSSQDILRDVFGYTAFRGEQQAIIDKLLEGENALVLMPTGGGKSLCYQIPALLLDGVSIVVSPLIALMQDQVSALQQLGVSAGCLHSGLSEDEERSTLQQLRGGGLKLIYMAPERLLNPGMLNNLHNLPVALIAIDEAHCVSQWGHDFRPEYTRLTELVEHFPEVPRIALTATAEQHTREDIRKHLRLETAPEFIASFDRPNITYRITERSGYKQALLTFLRQQHAGDAGIVYCLSRRKTDQTAEWLSQQGFEALPYHAGMSGAERAANQRAFINNEGIIMVATIAFGMGIDKPNVRFVAHLDLPKSLEGYYQETGRAGRDGLPASAWMMWGLQDVLTLRRFISESQASDAVRRIEHAKLDAMIGLCETPTCRRQTLLNYFDEQLPEPCGNCDRCLEPVETFDGTELAQKALSCVYRTGQTFGMSHVIDVLLGKETEKTLRFDHQQLSTFGIGDDRSAKAWRRIFRQLINKGYLFANQERFGALQLTAAAKPVLTGLANVLLMSEPKRLPKAGAAKTVELPPDYDPELFERLKQLRLQLAREQNIPPYLIFHDGALRQMAALKPASHAELLSISGVGQVKLENYGELFLQSIHTHRQAAAT